MLHYSNSTQIISADIFQCLNIPSRLKFFKNVLTEDMQREDSNVVVEYFNIKLETNLKSELKKAI